MHKALLLAALGLVACSPPAENVRSFAVFTGTRLDNCIDFYPDQGHSLDEYEEFLDILAQSEALVEVPGWCNDFVQGFAPSNVCQSVPLPGQQTGLLASSYQYTPTPDDQMWCEAEGGTFRDLP